MFWDNTDFTPAAQLALRGALIECSVKEADPDHAFLAMLSAENSSLVQACRFLRPAFNAKSLRESVVIRIKSSSVLDLPPPWSMKLASDRLKAVIDSVSQRSEWPTADRLFRDQLFAAEVVSALSTGVKTILTRAGISPDELINRLRRPAQRRAADSVIWDEAGRLNLAAFDRSAQKLLKLIETEGQGRGLNRIVTSLVLLSFVSIEGGVLTAGLRLQAPVVDVRKFRENLSQHVQSLGNGRFNGTLQLHRDQMQSTVIQVLEHSVTEADSVDLDLIGEAELLKSFMAAADPFVDSFFRGERVDLTELSKYLAQRRTGEVAAVPEEAPALMSVPEVEQRLRNTIIGQDHAIDIVMPIIQRIRFDYLPKGRPAGVLLFVGMSGTGKTQLAKEIARAVYGSEEQLIYLEMGQFGSEHSKTSFVGAPPGLVGYGEGILTNGLRDKPESVVLFDEVEKAHKSVFDVVLRFLDEGQIADASGVVRDGSRCILILTSNLGLVELEPLIAKQTVSFNAGADSIADTRQQVRDTLKNIEFFRPEFLNRVDEIVLFNTFTANTLTRIIQNILTEEVSRFREEKELEVRVDDQLCDLLVKKCLTRSKEGARACRRLVADYVVTPLITFFMDPANAHARGALVRPGTVKPSGYHTLSVSVEELRL